MTAPPPSAPSPGFSTLNAPAAVQEAAYAAGHRLAWFRSQSLDRFVATLLERWPEGASHVLCLLPPALPGAPRPIVNLSSQTPADWPGDPECPIPLKEQSRALASTTRLYLSQCIFHENSLGQAELVRAFAASPEKFMTREQWQQWPAQHREPAFSAWLASRQLTSSLPTAPPTVGGLRL